MREKNERGYVRTDLATECRARVGEKATNIDGVDFFERSSKKVTVSKLSVKSDEGAKVIGKPIGEYITIGFEKPWLMSDEEFDEVKSETIAALHELITKLLKRKKNEDNKVGKDRSEISFLIVGLGNRNMTSDRIGPASVSFVMATRHLKDNEERLLRRLNKPEISAIIPGVYGETGIESAEAVKQICSLVDPDIIIAVDSLASRSPDRLMRTIQLCDCGISPGSGVNNSRKALNEEYLGIPVIAIGVPCVVDSSTLVYDALEKAGISEDIPDCLTEVLNDGKNFFVSLKECDICSDELSRLISEAIDETLISDRLASS